MRAPYLDDGDVVLYAGDCVEVMAEMPAGSVDAVVTDPPYSLGFMGREWDSHEGREDVAFGYYLSGLIDGEGHFRVGPAERRCEFALKLRADDRAILVAARRFIGHGRIVVEPERNGSAPQARLVIDTKDGCAALAGILARYPLRAKKALDLAVWAAAVGVWLDMPRGNRWHGPADRSRLEALGARLRDGRAYVDPPWSGHRFQDWCRVWAAEALRVLKPGGHLLAFGGTRTYHRLACAIEDAGFEIRDALVWLYGSGFPKSLDVSKAIDRRRDDYDDVCRVALWLRPHVERVGFDVVTRRFGFKDETMARARWTSRSQPQVPTWDQWLTLKALCGFGDEMDAEVWRLNGRKGTPGEAWHLREKVGEGWRVDRKEGVVNYGAGTPDGAYDITAPATPESARWQGWGTALKPGHEPIVVARKPLAERTVAAQALATGTGAINVDGCRIAANGRPLREPVGGGEYGGWGSVMGPTRATGTTDAGRWPANVVLDEQAAALLDAEVGERTSNSGTPFKRRDVGYHGGCEPTEAPGYYGDTGGPSRFFFVARDEEEDECRTAPERATSEASSTDGLGSSTTSSGRTPTDPSLPGCRSTTSTGARTTTGSPTSPSSPRPSTSESTPRTTGEAPMAGSGAAGSAAAGSPPPPSTSTSAAPGGSSTGAAGPAISPESLPINAGGVRFRYTSKAGREERDGSSHPTVKSLALMRWLVRLVTPPGGVVLDPFAGSGTTLRAAREEGFRAIGIEREADYLADAAHRLRQLSLFGEAW